MNTKKKCIRMLYATIALFLVSMIVVLVTVTGNGAIKQTPVSFVTDEGVTLTGTLYVPVGASADAPVPGVVVAPGGNTPHTFYYSYSLELARRGYAVFAYDYYGTVGSGMTTQGVSGSIAAMKYLAGLSFVDTNRLAATGHSNGGNQAFNAITSEAAQQAEKRAVIFIGCGISAPDIAMLDGINVAAIWGRKDEAGQGTMWDTVHKDRLNMPKIADMCGTTADELVFGQIYGDFANGSARVLYNPDTFHSMSNLAPSTVTNVIDFLDASLEHTSTIPSTSHIYLWHELAVTLAALALCLMIFPVGMLLADLSFFASIQRPIPEGRSSARDPKFWLFLLAPGVISALLVKNSIMQGQTLMGKAPRLFNIQSTDGFIWWFFLSCLVGIAFIAVRSFVDKSFDGRQLLSNFRMSPANIAKSILLGLATVAVPYSFGVIGERVTGGWYARIFQTYMVSIHNTRLYEFPVYFIMFFVLFLVFAGIQADGLRLGNGKGKADYWLTLLANALPALLFCGYVFGKMVLTHVTAINGREMSRANGAMLGMLLIYFLIAGVVTKFYKKTGSIYVVAAVNAAFVTWVSINTQQFIV